MITHAGMNYPYGQHLAYALPATLMVGRYGVATLEWAPPAGSVAGRYVITVQGLSSHVARAVPFEVQR